MTAMIETQVAGQKKTLADLRQELASLVQRTGENHPSVLKAKNQIASAEKQLDDTLAQMRKQAFQLQALLADTTSVDFSMDASFYSKPAERNNQPLPGLWTLRGQYDKDRSTATVKVGIAAGPWETRARSEGNLSATTHGEIEVIFSEAAESRGFTSVSVTDREFERPCRIIAIEKQNRTQICISAPLTNTGHMRVSQANFFGLALKDVKEFQFQTRPYEWVTFPDIPLRPGLKSFRAAALETSPRKVPAETKGRGER
jgi:hypothetical protein